MSSGHRRSSAEVGRLNSEVSTWTGRAVFVTKSPANTVDGEAGTPSSPISIQSTPSPTNLRRPRAVATYSSIARTAHTPTKISKHSPIANVTSNCPTRPFSAMSNASSLSGDSSSVGPSRQLHPFFTKGKEIQRAKSVPVPQPQRPRFVASYSSTSASMSTQQTSESASTWGDSLPSQNSQDKEGGQIKGKGKERFDGSEEVRKTQDGSEAREPLKEVDIDRIIEQVERVDLSGKFRENPWDSRKSQAQSSLNNALDPEFESGMPKQTTLKFGSISRPTSPPRSELPSFSYRSFMPLHSDSHRPPKVVYTASLSEANDLLSCLKGPVLGFDLEWPIAGKHKVVDRMTGKTRTVNVGMTWDAVRNKYVFGQGRVALMQFCDEKLIVLIHLKEGRNIPTKAIEILENPNIYVTGVQVRGDGMKLLRDFPNLFPRGMTNLLELTYLARRVDPVAMGPGQGLVSLATLCRKYLGKTLDKEASVRQSNWLDELTSQQVEYAANDVYASLQIYLSLAKLAEQRGIESRLPACSNNIAPDGKAYPTEGKPIVQSVKPLKSDIVANRPTEPPSPKGPSPAQAKAFEKFQAGMSFAQIADEGGIKESTVVSYVFKAVQILGDDSLTLDDKRRFVETFSETNSASLVFKDTLRRMRQELGCEEEKQS